MKKGREIVWSNQYTAYLEKKLHFRRSSLLKFSVGGFQIRSVQFIKKLKRWTDFLPIRSTVPRPLK